ncbi:MAG TPA: SDR family oxidoreductase [Acidimicrobiales bacterium]|nr:SDR family oxidoreductase [Acidimicrobiales bacterium]
MPLAIDLSGQVALVTGAGRGIGREIANRLRMAGATVVAADRDESLVDDLPEGIHGLVLDVTSASEVERGVEKAFTDHGEVRILVNNAGIASSHHGMPFTNQLPEDWSRVYEVNVLGAVHVTRAWQQLRPRSDAPGVIINMASVAAKLPTVTDPAYSASKAALVAFTQSLTRDLAPHVRVCAVCPGMVMTPFYMNQYGLTASHDQSVAQQSPEDFFAAKAKSLIPLGAGQTPTDVANAVAFLASDLAGAITGQSLNVDGGLVMG